MEQPGLIFTFLLLLISTSLFYNLCSAEEDPEGAPEMPCKAAVSLLMKRQMAGITKCTKSMKFKNGKDKAAKMNCILKCVATGERMLNSESLLDKQNLEEFVKREIPRNLVAKAGPILWACYDGSVGKLDPKEEYCESYKPMIKCIMDAIAKFCVE